MRVMRYTNGRLELGWTFIYENPQEPQRTGSYDGMRTSLAHLHAVIVAPFFATGSMVPCAWIPGAYLDCAYQVILSVHFCDRDNGSMPIQGQKRLRRSSWELLMIEPSTRALPRRVIEELGGTAKAQDEPGRTVVNAEVPKSGRMSWAKHASSTREGKIMS